MLGFLWREENWRTWRKTFGVRQEPPTNSTHIWHQAGIKLSPYGWEVNALIPAPVPDD